MSIEDEILESNKPQTEPVVPIAATPPPAQPSQPVTPARATSIGLESVTAPSRTGDRPRPTLHIERTPRPVQNHQDNRLEDLGYNSPESHEIELEKRTPVMTKAGLASALPSPEQKAEIKRKSKSVAKKTKLIAAKHLPKVWSELLAVVKLVTRVANRIFLGFKKSSHKKIWLAGSTVVFMFVAFAALPLLKSDKKPGQGSEVAGAETSLTDSNSKSGFTQSKPNYDLVVPQNAPVADSKIRYDTTKELSTYTSEYLGQTMVVSLQKLSEKDAADPGLLIKVKDSFEANVNFLTNKGSVFVYNKEEKKQHVAIMIYKNFLIFMQYPRVLTDNEWKNFINSLD